MSIHKFRKLLVAVVDHLINPQADHCLSIDVVNNNTTVYTIQDMPRNKESLVKVTHESLYQIQLGTTTYRIPKTHEALINFRKKLNKLKNHKIEGMSEQFLKQKIAQNVCQDNLEAMFCEAAEIEVLRLNSQN